MVEILRERLAAGGTGTGTGSGTGRVPGNAGGVFV
jgi:hypothetical protein